MELVEIRDLDGPNLFALRPVLKLEVRLESEELIGDARRQYIAEHTGHYVSADPAQALATTITALYRILNLDVENPSIHEMDSPGYVSICFPWDHRFRARGVARTAFDLVAGERIERLKPYLENAIAGEVDDDEPEAPTWIRDTERSIPCAAVTGTNGKTTTTRILSHILRSTGKRVGWSSSSGVYIDGTQVIDGDYTGHGGARRVLMDPGVDCGVLETARGGILLRGLGYESNDVGVLLNVGPDHLGLHGVHDVETLVQVKATVVRTTRPGGTVVLNADDPLVLAQRDGIQARIILISQEPENPAIAEHLASGGDCLLLHRGMIMLCCGQERKVIIPVADVPVTYGGIAPHMVENTLAATAAAIGMGISAEDIASALQTFHPDRDHNAGRLNVFELDDVTVVVDFAHNESGLQFLLNFARQLFPDSSRVTAVVGTAGDRQDDVFIGLGRIAGDLADRVLVKTNPKHLRGRTPESVLDLVMTGIREAGAADKFGGVHDSEYDAVMAAIESAEPGEVIVAMSVEDYLAIMDDLIIRGARERSPA
jgi:cyanophycin synthetase